MLSDWLKGCQRRWYAEGGYREVLAISVPLIISTGAWSVQHFVDRMFLTWYSEEAVAASMPAGMTHFVFLSLFVGTASYVGTFVAQYYGAQRHQRIGPATWQGLYVAAVAGLLHLCLIPLAGPWFRAVGHEPGVVQNEIIYFQMLCLGAAPVVGGAALAGFFSGRGKTWVVMVVNLVVTGLNLVLDYGLVFGRFGLPEWGIKGAGVATVLSVALGLPLYALFIWLSTPHRKYHMLRGWRPDPALFRRLIRFGVPSGMQYFLDVAGFTAFVLLVGRLGTTELAATSIAFNINSLAFMPMIGIGMAVSILTGQHLGRDRPDVAERGAWSGFHLTMIYMTLIAAAYVFAPDLFLGPFTARMSSDQVEDIRPLVVVLLRFIALYSLFDGLNIIFASAIKGAGDTRFVMLIILLVSGGVLVVPSYLALGVFGLGLYAAWGILTAYVIILGFCFLGRFLTGKWKSMRVIEQPPPAPLPATVAESPTAEM